MPELCVCEGFMEIHTSRSVLCSITQCGASLLLQDTAKLTHSYKFKLRVSKVSYFIFAGPSLFLGTTRVPLAFQVFGTASVREVQYQGISSLWQWSQSGLRGLFTSK